MAAAAVIPGVDDRRAVLATTARHRQRRWWMAALIVLLAVVLAADISSGSAARSVQVQALWYGTAADGSIQAGVTPVEITARDDDPSTPLSVDVGALQAAGAGPMWTAATAVADVQAVLIAGSDPRRIQVSYSLKEAIDGPSAGGLLSAGTIAAIHGMPLAPDTTMTGTVLPDGSVGPVSGIPNKIRAAEEAGFSRVLVPAGPGYDLRTGKQVDLVALGRSLGVTVTPVTSVPDAYALLTRTPESSGSSQPSALNPRVSRMLERRGRVLIAATANQLDRLSAKNDRPVQTALPGIRAWLATAEQALVRGDAVLAFTGAAEAGQATQQVTAVDRLHRSPTSLPGRVSQVRQEAAQAKSVIQHQLLATAQTPVTTIEQLAALPDVLAWGTFAVTSMDVAGTQLTSVHTEADLDRIEQFIQTARFEAANYMPATAESLPFIGNRSIADADHAAQLLDAYATLIAYGANANRVYADSLRPSPDRDSYLRQLIDDAQPLTVNTSLGAQKISPSARAALRMAAALLEFVETTQLVNDLTSRPTPESHSPPNVLPIENPATVAMQASTAAEIASTQTAAITAAGLDPSYLEWNSRWGEQLSLGRLPEITDEQTLHGLEYQWFAVLQSRELIALSRQ